MVRYPHTAFLVVKSDDDQDGNASLDGDGNPIVISEPEKTQIECRYEPNSQKKNLDYSGKIYTPIIESVRFSKDGHYLEFEGVRFVIVQLNNYQRHCEIWLE